MNLSRHSWQRAAWCFFFGTIAAWGANRFATVGPQSNGWVRLAGQMQTNQCLTLEASSNLVNWGRVALLDYRFFDLANWTIQGATNESFQFLDPARPSGNRRFYRFGTAPFSATNDWKNQVVFPNDGFLQRQSRFEDNTIRWIKFAILLNEPWRVYYQDSRKYLLHYDFATNRFASFRNLDRTAFDQVSLFASNQQVLLGAVLLPPNDTTPEYGIQFAGRDAFPRELMRQAFEVVCATIVAPPEARPFYFPAFEQTSVAETEMDYFATNGIRVSSVNRWLAGNQVYAPGWALGRVRFVTATNINTAYRAGSLLPQDILLTDGVPAEVPFVSGIISLAPATPNSHVAILANGFGVPFVYLANAADRAWAQALLTQEVVLQASLADDFGRVSLLRVEGNLDATLRAELLALKVPPQAHIQPKARYGAYSVSADFLWPADIQYFGGKAAHFGLVRRTIATNSPVAIAFSFDLWDDFMGQVLLSGRTLGEEIRARLSGYNYPPNMASVTTNLAAIRDLITRTAHFTVEQQQAITNALAIFDPLRKIRFRSSSNAEDSETFTAAGLYDSYSGCLADDLDGDGAGPCRCDASEPNERGVFRAIQKVYASFYNDNAFLERLRHGIDESQVGMGLLVHHSTSDEEEWANGVATVGYERTTSGSYALYAKLVTQQGAVSVANPEGNARPEVVECNASSSPTLMESSSLVPLGSYVMAWTGDYTNLCRLLYKCYTNYLAALKITNYLTQLDFEYKRVAPGKLRVKQLRPLTIPATVAATRYIINEPSTYWVYEVEGSDAFANHRLKCNLTLQNYSGRLDTTNLAQRLYTDATFEFRQGTNILTLTGPPSTWTGATHSVSNESRGLVVRDGWTVGSGTNQWRLELQSVLPGASSQTPFLAQAEIRKYLTVTYPAPVPVIRTSTLILTNTATEKVQLVLRPDIGTLSPAPGETLINSTGIKVEVAFLNSTNALGPPIGVDKHPFGYYPLSVSPWTHTTITGLLSTPLELRGYWSQSAAAGHHNMWAWYLFEPSLEPGLSPAQLAELETRNIQVLFIQRTPPWVGQPQFLILGCDGQLRTL